jgi:hypothetical protein
VFNSFGQTKPGATDVPLTIFGGAAPEMSNTDLPEGASAGNQDVDYSLGKVFTRPGLENVFSFEGLLETCLASSGVSVAVEGSVDEVTWTNPSGITNASCATVGVNVPGGPAAPTQLQFGQDAVSTGDAIVAMPIATSKVVILAGTSYGAYGIADSLGLLPGVIFQLQENVPDGGIVGHMTVGLSAITTLTFAGADTWTLNPTQFGIGASLVTFEFDGLNLGAVPGTSAAPTFDDHISTSGSLGGTSGSPVVSAGSGFTADATYQYVESVINTPIAVCVQHMQAGAPGTYPVAFASNMGAISAGNLTTTQPGDWIVAIATLNGNNGDWGVCAYAIPLANSSGTPSGGTSQLLKASAFPCLLSIPADVSIVGIQVSLTGQQSNEDPTSIVSVTLINPTNPTPPRMIQLPLTEGTVTLGGPTDPWGQSIQPGEIQTPLFGFNIQVSSDIETTFEVCGVSVSVWFTPPTIGPNADLFLYIKTFEMADEGTLTLALDTAGTFWQEDVINNPDVLVPFYTSIEPGTHAKSVTFESHEYIALSNLLNGTDMPRQYDGVNVDRISQVGPGAPPSITSTSTTYPIISITQPPAVTSGGTLGPGISALLWSAGPGNNSQAGNVITIYYGVPGSGNPATPPDPNILVGGCVYLAGFANLKSGANPNGTYVISSVIGQAGFKGRIYNAFTVAAVSSQLEDDDGIDNPAPTGTYNATIATLTTSVPVPNLQVGSQFTVTGNSVAAWNATWTVTATPNAAVLTITQTSLTGGVATYDYVLVSGTAPVVGSQVTITGSTNGPTLPNGLTIFDVANANVSTATASQFTINIAGQPNVAPAPETSCQAQVNGTIFQFEPGLAFVGTTPSSPPPNDPIFGNGTGGFITEAGQLGAGLRQCVLLFQTRNGFITGPSPYIQFNLNAGASSIVATKIAIGPPETIARILCFTGANGSQFYYIPEPVTVISNDQPITYTATVINDNITTQATFSFTDALLLSSTEIDIPSFNLFNLVELGSSLGVIDYSSRLFFWGEQNKVQNLLNMTFDGGYLPNPGGSLVPLGWTVDQTNGAGGTLEVSPLYGNAYYIKNSTGSTQALYGMLTQSAFQDQYLVGIVLPNFTYGARVTASCPSQTFGAGSYNVDLYSPSFGLIYGKFSIPFSSMGKNMEIFTGNVMTTAFVTTVPPDLMLRIYAAAIPNGGDVLVDRVEFFPLQQPILQNQFRASYEDEPEMFDGITGNTGPAQDNKPIAGAMVLFDSLYCLKADSGGTYVTTDNGITEPNRWNWKTVSRRIGTLGPYAYDYGENWYITADRQGLYGYGGGPLTKMSQEIQPVWDMMINRQATVVRNDIYQRRVTIFCCIPTPNKYMPELPVNANPTQPNVCIAMNYRELDSVEALVSGKPIHQTFMGTIRAFDFVRKWSYWNIQSPYADFCQRNDGSEQLLICSGITPKIYELEDDMLSDDGKAINSWYLTYGFVRPETQQAIGLGLGEMLLGYLKMTIIGNGELTLADFPNDPLTKTPSYWDPLTLSDPADGDLECPLNDVGYRFFMKVGTNAVGDWFELSKMVVTMSVNPWAPVSGLGV